MVKALVFTRPLLVALTAVAGLACQRPAARETRAAAPPSPADAAAAAAGGPTLPDVTGFTAAPAIQIAGGQRRAYRRGDVVVEVTLARFSMDAEQYQH